MSAIPITPNIKPVCKALDELEAELPNITGMVVLTSDADGNYDYYIAGVVGAEQTIGRLEVIKAALLSKVFSK